MLTRQIVDSAIANAIDLLNRTREPHALLFMTIIHRRFGIEAFADAYERYDAVLPEHPDQAPVLRVLRRVFDADNPIVPADWERVKLSTDRMLVAALYCDRIGLPETFPDVLARAVDQGGYAATHALLACTWASDNGRPPALPNGFLDRMYGAVAAIVESDPGSIDDMKLEAAAFLCLARQSARVDPGFVGRVVTIQNEDGGWGRATVHTANSADQANQNGPDDSRSWNDPRSSDDPRSSGIPGGSSWHSTILALILLLHIDFPDEPGRQH